MVLAECFMGRCCLTRPCPALEVGLYLLLWLLPFVMGRRELQIPQLEFCHLQPHCLLPQKEPFSCWSLARVEAKGQRRWDTRAGLFLPVAQCAAPPASCSRIQRGQTLPLSEGLVPLPCRALCFRGLPELQRELDLSASRLHAAKAAGELWSGVSPSSAQLLLPIPNPQPLAVTGVLMLPGRAAWCCGEALPFCTTYNTEV